MRTLQVTSQFRKDLKKAIKRGKEISELEHVVDMLLAEEKLPEKYKDHGLAGEYIGKRECHIQPDWLLIYEYSGNQLLLILTRTGTHSDLFR